jgi:hypothetical protein
MSTSIGQDDGSGTDPVIVRRERIRRLVEFGRRIGYSCFATAMVLFVAAFLLDFPSALVSIIVGCLVVGTITLPPAIVFGYGIKAADAEDRGEKFGY